MAEATQLWGINNVLRWDAAPDAEEANLTHQRLQVRDNTETVMATLTATSTATSTKTKTETNRETMTPVSTKTKTETKTEAKTST
ncbi:hypothetical protein LTR60_001681, partial [Cryomyces antarcticus]